MFRSEPKITPPQRSDVVFFPQRRPPEVLSASHPESLFEGPRGPVVIFSRRGEAWARGSKVDPRAHPGVRLGRSSLEAPGSRGSSSSSSSCARALAHSWPDGGRRAERLRASSKRFESLTVSPDLGAAAAAAAGPRPLRCPEVPSNTNSQRTNTVDPWKRLRALSPPRAPHFH